MEKPNGSGSFMIEYEFSPTGNDVLIVGVRRKNGVVAVINRFSGEDAIAVYQKIMEGAHGKPN